MKIIEEGTIVQFSCGSCGCKFVVGINVVDARNNDGNYYADCPRCGCNCHSDVNAISGKWGTNER